MGLTERRLILHFLSKKGVMKKAELARLLYEFDNKCYPLSYEWLHFGENVWSNELQNDLFFLKDEGLIELEGENVQIVKG